MTKIKISSDDSTAVEETSLISTLEAPEAPPPVLPAESVLIASSEGKWDKIIRGLIYSLTFLLPLLFTSWTFEPLEFSKQMLMFLLLTAAVVVWLLKLLVFRTWRFVKTPLDLPILAFLLIYLLASVFSIDRIASFMGFYGSFQGNFFQILFLIVFYYLVVNNFQNHGQIKKLFGIYLFSGCLALLYTVLQFFNVYLLPFALTRAPSFNTIGGLLILSLFSAYSIVLTLGLQSNSWFSINSGKLWRVLVAICALLVLLTVNFLYAWIGLAVGVLLYMVFQVAFSGGFNVRNILAPLVLLILIVALVIIQLVFPFISVRNWFNFNLPLEIRLDYTTAQPVLKGAISERPILGLGPNTFLYAFSKYRDQSFNLGPFWNLRFDRAPSEIAEYFVGSGILGALTFEILTAVFLIYGLYFLVRSREKAEWATALGLFAAFAVLWFAHWFFFFNSVITYSFWLTLAGFVALTRAAGGEKVKVYNFSLQDSPRQTVSIVTGVSLVLILIIIFTFFASAVYASDIFYRKGLDAARNPENYDTAQANLERAIRLNRFRPDYYLSYGEFLLVRINQELSGAEPNLNRIQGWLATSINNSRAAVQLSPTNWTAWERLANLYVFARPLVAGVDKFIIESLQKATDNDIKNPILWTELGQIYRLAARRIDPGILGKGPDSDSDGLTDEQEQAINSDSSDPDTNGNNILDGTEVLGGLNPAGSGALPDAFLSRYIKIDAENLLKAEDAFRTAVALKEDYLAPQYQLALTLEQQQKFDEAIVELEKALERFAGNVTVKFDLGRLYFNTNKIDQAVRQFREIVTLVPNHANARFSLAISYERQGNLKKALEEYKKVLELNPDNQPIKDKVSELDTAIQKQQQEAERLKKRGGR